MYLVHIQDRRYRVSDDEIAQVRVAIEMAVRDGGSLITIGHDDLVTEVLVTPGSSITINKAGDLHPVTSDDSAWQPHAGFDDFALEA